MNGIVYVFSGLCVGFIVSNFAFAVAGQRVLDRANILEDQLNQYIPGAWESEESFCSRAIELYPKTRELIK